MVSTLIVTDIEFHDAANIFPLDEEHIAELAIDIQKNGQLVPIELINGKILDGRRRYLACQSADIEPTFKNVNPENPFAYVLSLNVHRRQLTASQRAMAVDRGRELQESAAKERMSAGGGDRKSKTAKSGPVTVPEAIKGDTRDILGKAAGVSGSLVDAARKVRKEGVPELAKAVEDGRLSVTKAAKAVDKPEEVQRELAAAAKFSGGRYRNQDVDAPDSTFDMESFIRKATLAIERLGKECPEESHMAFANLLRTLAKNYKRSE